jgi:acyl carrier protein
MNMERQEIINRVKKVVAQVLKTTTEISDDANFIFDLGADSMQSVMLVAAFEEEFGIEMEEDKALQIQTVSDAADFIVGYLK